MRIQFPFLSEQTVFPHHFIFFNMLVISCMTLMVKLLLFNVLNQFTKTSTVCNYNTRASSRELFYVKATRTAGIKTYFARIGVLIWNSIPCSVRFFVNLNFVKLSRKYFSIRKGKYIEVSQLINYFSKY